MLVTRIMMLEARLEWKRHPEDHACQSDAIYHELLDVLENLQGTKSFSWKDTNTRGSTTCFHLANKIHSQASLPRQLYLKMKTNIQDQATDQSDITMITIMMLGKKGEKENNKDLFFLKNRNTKESLSLNKIHIVPFLEVDVEEMMNHSWHKRIYKVNQRRVRANPKEYFFVHKIVELLRVTTKQQHELDSMEQIIMMRENVKPYCFSEADFKYMNKNDIEDMRESWLSTGNRKLPDQDQLNRTNVDIPWYGHMKVVVFVCGGVVGGSATVVVVM
nr:hypothetical protein [Tanacetum cinerariifolium]